METLSAKFFSFLFLTVFGGGWTVPLGLPPAPENPELARIAPEKCLLYISWAGTAPADSKSKNQTEQLLAEPQVQRSSGAWAALAYNAAVENLSSTTYEDSAAPSTGLPPSVASTQTAGKEKYFAAFNQISGDFAQIVATHPGAIYATQIKLSADMMPLDVRGGMLVAAGRDAGALRTALDHVCKYFNDVTPGQVHEVQIEGAKWYRIANPADPKQAPLICGFQGSDFIAGIGEGSVEEILQRRRRDPPSWLVNLRKELPVERTSTVLYVNSKLLWAHFAAGKSIPKTMAAARSLGLDKIVSIASVSGLEGETYTSKLLLSTDGEPQGILRVFSDQPLRAGDLKPIPRDSTLSLAMRYDAEKLADHLLALAALIEGEPAAAGPANPLEKCIDAVSRVVKVDFRRELPKGLGDTCCIYSSPGEGGLITVVAPIKDKSALSAIQLKLVTSSLAGSLAAGFSEGLSRPLMSPAPRLISFEFKGQRIYYYMGMPAAPSWCITEHELVIAFTPQNVMAYLERGPEEKSLAAVPQVGKLLEGSSVPGTLAHIDTMRVFELIYPLLPLAAASGFDTSYAGLDQPLPLDAFPSFPTIRRHLVPGTAALRRTKRGLELVSRQPLPGTGLFWTAAMLMETPQTTEQQVAAEERRRNGAQYASDGATTPYTAPAAGIFPFYAPPTYAPPPGTAPVGSADGAPAISPYEPAAAGAYPSLPIVTIDQRLSTIGKGIKAYRIKQKAMPPSHLADKQGKPLLSWRVAILPYLGQEDLYKQFHLDEPWDSPHNWPLIALMPEVYRESASFFDGAPSTTCAPGLMPIAQPKLSPAETAGKTRFLLLRGPKTVYADVSPPMPRTYEDWTKTIVVVVSAERAVPWTKPEEFTYDPKDPADGLSEDIGEPMLQAGSAPIRFTPLISSDKSQVEEFRRSHLLNAFTGEERPDSVIALPPAPAPKTRTVY